jgi:hypothetical protein
MRKGNYTAIQQSRTEIPSSEKNPDKSRTSALAASPPGLRVADSSPCLISQAKCVRARQQDGDTPGASVQGGMPSEWTAGGGVFGGNPGVEIEVGCCEVTGRAQELVPRRGGW